MIRITIDRSRTSANLFLKDMALAHETCHGTGAELNAAAHNPFSLDGSINVFLGDRETSERFREHQLQLCGAYAEVDRWGLQEVDDDTLDYVLSAHVLQEAPDLFALLDEVERVVKDGGIFFAIVPKRDALPADAGRELTTIEELQTDYQSDELPANCRHVFDLASIGAIIAYHKPHWETITGEETDSKVGNGHTVVFRVRKAIPDSDGISHEDSVAAMPEATGNAEAKPKRKRKA